MNFQSDLETFKRLVAKFLGHCVDGVRGEALDAAFKCVTLHYLNLQGSDADRFIAIGYMDFAIAEKTKIDIGMDTVRLTALMVSPYIREGKVAKCR